MHEILRTRILNNEIPAGAPLLEVALAEEFGVSRTTIRAAVRELQAERLVEITPRRSTTVIRMSEADAREVCFARYSLEGVSLRELRRPARRAVADSMAEIVREMEICSEKGDMAGMVEADTALHRVVVEAAGHPLVMEMWSRLNGQMGALMRSSLDRQRIDLDETVRRHADLVGAYRDESPSRIDAALRDHYVSAVHPEEEPISG
ncbi:MAG TPA: GntR family transcriptional regulator [Nocardioidaceae bacterium]|nr:GntR family transcriptional regulator [Nocardioidaceae bacterium]